VNDFGDSAPRGLLDSGEWHGRTTLSAELSEGRDLMTTSAEDVADELRRAGCKYASERQCEKLSQLLMDGETILDAIAAYEKKRPYIDQTDRAHLLTITSLRMLSVRQEPDGFFSNGDIVSSQMYWNDIASVGFSGKSRDQTGSVSITGYTAQIGTIHFLPHDRRGMGVPPLTEQELIDFGQRLQTRLAAMKSGSATPDRSSGSLVDQLERLSALRERGVISEEEFQLAKRKLLSD
jgi:hypothetical protein